MEKEKRIGRLKDVRSPRFPNWKAFKHAIFAAGALTFLAAGGLAASSAPPVQALTLASGDSLVGNISSVSGNIPVVQSSTNQLGTQAMQNTFDSITRDYTGNAKYIVNNLSWGSNTALTNSTGTGLVPLSSYEVNGPNGTYNLFLLNGQVDTTNNTWVGSPESLGADGFKPNDLSTVFTPSSISTGSSGAVNSVNLGGIVKISNVGTAKDASGNSVPLDLLIQVQSVGIPESEGLNASNISGVLFSAHNEGGTISVGATPLVNGVTSSGGSNEGGIVDGNGQQVGQALGYINYVRYTTTLINHNTGDALPDDTLLAMKVSDIDGYQVASTSTDNWLGTVVSSDTALTINGNGLSLNSAQTTIADSSKIAPNAYVAIKTTSTNNITFADQSGMGDPNEGTHFDIVADLFGSMNGTVLNVNNYVENTLTKTQAANTYPAGLTQAGAVFKIKNLNTGNFVKASDGNSTNPIAKTAGTLSTASDGSLTWTTGADGKVGAAYLPAYDSSGKVIQYQWTEVKAPKGEAIQASGDGQTFSYDPSYDKDSTNQNSEAPATKISDQPMVETGIAKLDADTLGASTNGIPNLSGGEFTLEDSKGNVIKQSQGLNPQTGAQANVALSSGAQYAPDANGNIVLVTNAQGSAGFVYNIDLPTADGLQWVETKAPNGFAINDNPVTITFDSSNAIDNTTNNVEDNKANSSTISDQPLLEATLDKDSTNAEFNHVLGKAVYELQTQAGVPIKQAQGLDPKTGDSANIVVVTGTFVSNTAGNLDVQATADGLIDVKNIDGTLVPKDVQWVELSPADGHALNNVPAQTSFDKGTYSSDASNFLAVSKTTDKPMGETAIAKCDADTGDNTTQGAATLQGAEFTLEDLTGTPIKQTQGVDPQTGAQANVVLAAGTSYAPDANGNIVVVTNAQGIGGQVQNIDLSNNLNYQWVETKAPYGYTINTKPIEVDFSASNEVDSNTNNYKDGLKLGATISDRVVDFDFAFIKAATDNGATGLNGAEFTLTPLTGTLNALGQYDNGKDTNINGQDTYINPDTGLATPVTDVSQLYLGAVQTSHDYTDPQGGQSAGWVEYDHVQVGKYKVSETKVPDGETQAHDLEVDILPDTTTDGAPTSYEFKVIDLVTKNVLRDVTIPVSYSPTQDGRQLLNDNNFLGKFNLGSIFDSPTTPPTPSIDVEKANDAMPTAGKGNDTDSNNNAGPNDHDTAATADVLKEGATTPIDFLFTNNGTDDLTQLKPVDKTTNGSISVKDITYTYNGTTLSLNADGYLTNADGSLFVLPAGQAIQATGTLPALPVGELHTDEVNINAVGVKSGTPVHDHDDWNGIVPKPSIDIEKANGSIPNAGNGNHTDKANNAGANDHDTVATLDPIKAGTSTAIYFRGTNNGTEALSHIKVSDTTTDGSVSIGSIVWTYQGQTLKINASGELTLQDGTLLTLQPKDTITGEGTLPALPAGELHGDDVTISGIGVLDNKSVGDDDKWYGEVTPHDSIDIEKANDTMPKAGNGNNTDKANNVGTNDHDTAATADDLKVGATTPIYFRITNNGNEALTQVTPVDKTIEGTATLSAITWTYNGQKLTLSKDGAFVTTDGKLLVLPVGGTVTGAATLAALGTDQTTADEASVTGVGVNSHNKVGDKDDWYGKTQKLTVVPPQTPSAPKSNVYNIIIPDTGTALGQFQLVGYIIIALVIGNVVYYIVKKRRNKEDEAA